MIWGMSATDDAGRGPILVSACLVGAACRYDGAARTDAALVAELTGGGGPWVLLCPEQMAGLPTPRARSFFVGGPGADVIDGRACVMNADGTDVTDAFLAAARQVVALCREWGVRRAILKDRSPACGCTCVYVGEQLTPGRGVTAEALAQAGIELECR